MSVRTAADVVPFEDAVARYDPVIGLETHVELGTVTKMFCGCPNRFGGEPNSLVCPVCLGLPGSLPVINRAAIEYTIRIGLALNCSIASWCRFARKNYFYPDMPKNYQISQYDEPLCTDGWLDVTVHDTPDGQPRAVRVEIERVHLEEDTGKSMHMGGDGRIHGADYSLVDYNRAGIPLVEIVTKPLTGTGELAPAAARAYVTELRDLLRTLGVSDVRMEEGSLRCDVNTSLMPRGGHRIRHPDRDQERELAPLGGARGPLRDRAAGRGAGRRAAGGPGDPALPGVHRHHVARAEQGRGPGLPVLPRARPGAAGPARRPGSRRSGPTCRNCPAPGRPGCRPSGACPTRTWPRCTTPGRWIWWPRRSRRARRPPTPASGGSANWPGRPTTRAPTWLACRSHRRTWPGSVRWPTSGALTDRLARQVIEGVLAGEGTPDEVVARRGLAVVSDDAALAAAVDEAIAANPEVAEKIRGGKVAAAGALVGAVMKATQGKADASRVKQLILDRLGPA